MKKLGKVLGILGGLYVFSEVCAALGEAQMLWAMNCDYPDEVEETIEQFTDDTYLSGLPKYRQLRCKFIANMAKLYIEAYSKRLIFKVREGSLEKS